MTDAPTRLSPAEALALRWQALCRDLGMDSPYVLATGAELIRAWSAPQRQAHNLEYLGECLLLADELHALAFRPLQVETALWFHRAVLDTRRSDSEALSAVWASRVLAAGGMAAADVETVRRLIMATRADAAPLPGDEALIADIADAVMGAPTERFERYDAALRWESPQVPAPAYRAARRQAIRERLGRPQLFRTEVLRKRFEQTARDNLARALRRQWRVR